MNDNGKVAFIYHGSSGVAGGYTAKFVEGLAIHSKVHAFVNFGYAYKHLHPNIKIHRVFFPITDSLFTRKIFLQRAVRFLELVFAYVIVVASLAVIRANFVIYSPITNLLITDRFVAFAKRLCGRLAIVVHDSQSHYDVAERYRDAVFTRADILVVHNEHSYSALKQRLPVPGAALLIPFPWSLVKLPIHQSTSAARVLLVGHVRPSKGIDFLLDAYPKYQRLGGGLELAVSGSMPVAVQKRIGDVASRVINKNLDDQTFLKEIAASKFLVMPYRPGYSNSSVHYCSVIHCGTPFICSDIELFSAFEDGVDCLKFKYGNVESFVSALSAAERLNDIDRTRMAASAFEKMKINMFSFDISVGSLFRLDCRNSGMFKDFGKI